MQKLGFEVVLKTFVPVYSDPMFGIENDIELLKQSAENLDYPIDGMVLGYKDIVYGDSLEATGHHLRSQIAFKFYDEEAKLDWKLLKYGGTSALNQTVPSVFAAFRVMTAMRWRFISRTTVVGQGFSRYFDNGFVLGRDYYGLYGPIQFG